MLKKRKSIPEKKSQPLLERIRVPLQPEQIAPTIAVASANASREAAFIDLEIYVQSRMVLCLTMNLEQTKALRIALKRHYEQVAERYPGGK